MTSERGPVIDGRVLERGRFASLDGLRGIAALVVLLYHAALLFDAFAALLGTPGSGVAPRALATLLDSPLMLPLAGNEAVWVFFVLSGFVLALPATVPSPHYWRAYYPSRLLRLYFPVWGAILFAMLLWFLVPRLTSPASVGAYAASVARFPSPKHVLAESGLFDSNFVLEPSLWSLTWEVLFSLLLPVYLIFAKRISTVKALAAGAALLVGLVTIGLYLAPRIQHGRIGATLVYLPMFAAGVLLACWMRNRAGEVTTISTPVGGVVFAGALLLLISRWVLEGFGVPGSLASDAGGLGVIGAALLVFLAISLKWLRSALEAPLPRFLGRISFSLYLTHPPVILMVRNLFAGEPAWLPALISIPAALAVGWSFWWLVERPAHLFSQKVRRRFSGQNQKVVVATAAP